MPDTNLLPLSGTQGVSSYTMSLSQLELTYRRALAPLAPQVVCHRVLTLSASNPDCRRPMDCAMDHALVCVLTLKPVGPTRAQGFVSMIGRHKKRMSVCESGWPGREDGIVLGRTAVVGHDTALGQGTVIGDGAQVPLIPTIMFACLLTWTCQSICGMEGAPAAAPPAHCDVAAEIAGHLPT